MLLAVVLAATAVVLWWILRRTRWSESLTAAVAVALVLSGMLAAGLLG